MNKRLFLAFSIFWVASSVLLSRTPQEAAVIASQFLASSSVDAIKRVQGSVGATTMSVAVGLSYTKYLSDGITPAIFVFDNQGGDGFVMVSAHDDGRAVLAYSDGGNFDPENIPENCQFWMQMYASEMMRMQSANTCGVSSLQQASNEEVVYPEVKPILDGVYWNQDAPFNGMCPVVNGVRSVTGCVATAMSQIMYAHKYPERGVGSHAYVLPNGDSVSACFDTVYDWANMLPSYYVDYTSEQADAVALLMYHLGVASNMQYSPIASGAVSAVMLRAITIYFGYDAAMRVLAKECMFEDDMLTSISNDLQLNMPVYFAGYSEQGTGHAFVCDGMQSNGYLHINWGWGGLANGYFALSALNPANQGIGGASGGYTERVSAYVGICPNKGGVAQPMMIADKMSRTSNDKISRNDSVIYVLDNLFNFGIVDAAGEYGIFIFDTEDSLVAALSQPDIVVPPGYGWGIAVFDTIIPAELPDGKYTIEVAYMDTIGVLWPIYVRGCKGKMSTSMEIFGDSITFEKMPIFVDLNKIQDFVQIDITNLNQSTEWEVTLSSSTFGTDQSQGKDVMMRCTLNSSSTTSVVGSYLLDATSSSEVGTINADVTFLAGYDTDHCIQYHPTDLQLTIVEDKNGAIKVDLYTIVDDLELDETLIFKAPRWMVQDSGELKDYTTDITGELASVIPASKALAISQSLRSGSTTNMRYFVDGIVSAFRVSPEDIARYKVARFDISDDGTTNNQLFCYGVRYLQNSDFITGEEIAIGDNVVIYGQLGNNYTYGSLIKGYVYNHTMAPVEEEIEPVLQEIYDLLGRKMSAAEELLSGVYVVREGDAVFKVYIP